MADIFSDVAECVAVEIPRHYPTTPCCILTARSVIAGLQIHQLIVVCRFVCGLSNISREKQG
jgi:hypothetical protein